MAHYIAPSLLSANYLKFGEELKEIEDAGADMHHVDVMDGHFVPNLTFGPPLIASLKKVTKIPLDVHIMVSNPDAVALEYVKAGADTLCFHVEAALHAHRLVGAIKAAGAKAGLAINPGTPLTSLWPLLPDIDQINVMSVNPGFGGQSFIPETVGRIQRIHEELVRCGRAREVAIEVDGGINEKTGAQVVEAGARILVAGHFIYGSDDRSGRIAALKGVA